MQPKLRLFSDGKHTYAELCSKSIGEGISSLSYSHDANSQDGGKLELKIDLSSFEFMEDGYFDRTERALMESDPLKDGER